MAGRGGARTSLDAVVGESPPLLPLSPFSLAPSWSTVISTPWRVQQHIVAAALLDERQLLFGQLIHLSERDAHRQLVQIDQQRDPPLRKRFVARCVLPA